MIGTRNNHTLSIPTIGTLISCCVAHCQNAGGECNVPFTYRFYSPSSYPRLDPKFTFYSVNVSLTRLMPVCTTNQANVLLGWLDR